LPVYIIQKLPQKLQTK